MLTTALSRKIVFLISLCLLIGCTAAVFLLAIAPTQRLQRDYDAYEALDSTLASLQIELLRTQTHPVERQISAVSRILDQLDEQFSYFTEQAYIRGRSTEAMDAIASLTGDHEAIQAGALVFFEAYMKDDASFSSGFIALVIQFSDSIDDIRTDITSRLPALARGIQTWRTYSYLLSGAIILIVWLLGLLVVWFYARVVAKNSGQVSTMLDSITSGKIDDVLEQIPESERGNPQTLPGKFAGFLTSLREMVVALKTEAAGASGSGEQLIESIDNASSTFEVVDGFIENMRNETTILEQQVKTVTSALSRVTSGLSQLDNGIAEQNEVMDGSLASVQSMIDSVSDMAENAKRDEVVVKDLVSSSGESREQFISTYNKITRISESISRINGMAEVIENIAEQTNMLALNAAIEAAHAGDAGKGFAVVAEEITKLAEASSESSREISSSIEEIVENITTMAHSSGALEESFETMIGDINTVYNTISRFSSELSQANTETTHVLKNMNTLQQVSDTVTKNSGLMSEGAGTIADSMKELEMMSSRVFEGITAISLMLDGIKEIMTKFRSIADEMMLSGENIQSRLEQLK